MNPPQPQPGGEAQGAPAQQPGGEEMAMQAIQMIQKGFEGLGQVIQGSNGALPPEDMQLFQGALSATDALIQSLTGPAGGDAPPEAKGAPGGPMPANANAGARPAPQG